MSGLKRSLSGRILPRLTLENQFERSANSLCSFVLGSLNHRRQGPGIRSHRITWQASQTARSRARIIHPLSSTLSRLHAPGTGSASTRVQCQSPRRRSRFEGPTVFPCHDLNLRTDLALNSPEEPSRGFCGAPAYLVRFSPSPQQDGGLIPGTMGRPRPSKNQTRSSLCL